MDVARERRAAGLARGVSEPSRRRAAGAGLASAVHSPRTPDQDRERLNAAFASIVKLMRGVSQECEKYYGAMATHKCKEREIKHFCKYHGRRVEMKHDSTEQRTEGSIASSHPRRLPKDFYIEVSPGIYSVTAMSEDMVQQTHVVDVSAGQSVDLTFVL